MILGLFVKFALGVGSLVTVHCCRKGGEDVRSRCCVRIESVKREEKERRGVIPGGKWEGKVAQTKIRCASRSDECDQVPVRMCSHNTDADGLDRMSDRKYHRRPDWGNFPGRTNNRAAVPLHISMSEERL